jgi:ankyrin repeat protein
MYDVNATDCMGNTPLSHAIQHYDRENPQITRDMLYILLKYGANPNQTDAGSPTPLMLAALREDVGIVNGLLLMGADPNIRLQEEGLFFKASDTALSLAIRSHTFLGKSNQSPGQLECICTILQNTRVPITPNVLFHALQQTKDPVVKAFIMGVSK